MHSRRELDPSPPAQPPIPWTYPDLILRTPPNWTAVAFVAMLAGLHLSVAAGAFTAGRWEGYVSLIFGTLLSVATAALYNLRREVAVLNRHGKLRLRTGVGRCSAERFIPFSAVRAVRVTLGPGGSVRHSLVELICHREDVPCPPSAVPRQLGLLLALMVGCPLVKVSEDVPDLEQTPAGRAATPAPQPDHP